ncbi:MAG: type IV toxin-antitoxin system AbiEi family antitoxin domain-containing protein [Candidatus Omnitrophota bacterium]
MEKLNSISVEKTLRKRGARLFTPLDFQRIFNASASATKNFLSRHLSSQLFVKVRNGLYALEDKPPDKFIVANKLYSPSYISFETALSFYHIIPETIYTVFSATPKPSRRFSALDSEYVYHRIRRKFFLGYTARKIDEATVLLAEPEKALADYLYFVDLKKKNLNSRLILKGLSKKSLYSYAKILQRKSLIKLLDSLYDK